MSVSVSESGNKLLLSISDETYNRSCGYDSSTLVIGAFDAYVAFDSFSATLSSGAVQAFIEFRVDAENYFRMARYKDSTGEDKYLATICDGGAITEGEGDLAVASGALRLKRTGMTVVCYYGEAYSVEGGTVYSWTEVASDGNFSTSRGRMRLLLSVDTTNTGAVNFSGYTFSKPSRALYEDHFVSRSKGQEKISVTKQGDKDYKKSYYYQIFYSFCLKNVIVIKAIHIKCFYASSIYPASARLFIFFIDPFR